MRARPLLVAVAAAATACAAVPEVAGADHRHPRCFPRGSDTVAMSARARVYETAEDENQNYAVVACALRTGRRVVLGTGMDIDYTYAVTTVRFTKWQLAVAWYSSSRYFYSAGLDLVDLRAGTKNGVTSMGWSGSVTDVELKPNGSVAWIQHREGTTTVMKQDASGRHELDSGAGVARDSLALSGSWLYWTKDGQPRVATLD